MRIHTADELLQKLQDCAHTLLLAYGETMQPTFWAAFEKTVEACETLAFPQNTITIH